MKIRRRFRVVFDIKILGYWDIETLSKYLNVPISKRAAGTKEVKSK